MVEGLDAIINTQRMARKKEPDELISIREYARRKGCSDTAVHKAIRAYKIDAGLVIKGKKKFINPEVADLEWRTNFDPAYGHKNENLTNEMTDKETNPNVVGGAKRGVKDPEPITGLPEGGPTIAKAKLKSEVLKAAKLELEYKEKVGSLVEKTKVYKALYEVGQEIRTAFQTLPDRVIDDVLAAPSRNHAHQIMFNAIADELDKISDMEKRLNKIK
jgi:hypothetical protein